MPLGGEGSVIPVFMFTDDEIGPPTQNALKHFVQLLVSRLNLRVSELIMSYTILEQVVVAVRVHNSNPMQLAWPEAARNDLLLTNTPTS